MNKETILFVIAIFLAVVLAVEGYSLYKVNDRLGQLAGQSQPAASPEIKLPLMPKPAMPKPLPDDEFFKDRSWSPYAEMQRMQDEMEQMFNQSMSRFHMNAPLGSLNKSPEVDLRETPEQYIVTVNAPGVDESSIDVKLDDQRLSIELKTEKGKDESDGQNGKYVYRERFVGEFRRVLTLPGPVDAAKMKTEYRNGVLTITVPKK